MKKGTFLESSSSVKRRSNIKNLLGKHSYRIKRCGLSVVELTVVILITAILSYLAFVLVVYSIEMFGKNEETTICTNESAMIISSLHRDLNRVVGVGISSDIDGLRSLLSISNGNMRIEITDGSGQISVEYSFDDEKKELKRLTDSNTRSMGKGRLAKFDVEIIALGENGALISDIESSSILGSTKIIRAWTKFIIRMEGVSDNRSGKLAGVVQNYEFRIFPVRLNHRLQSIWRE